MQNFRIIVNTLLLALAVLLGDVARAELYATAPDVYLEQRDARLTRCVLDNGLTVLVKEDHTAPLASLQIWIGTGSIHEQEHLGGGLAHLIEHMIFKGTPTRPLAAITRAIDDVGGTINAYTTLDRTVFHVDLPARHWRTGLDVLADAALHASFPEAEWRREKEVVVREMAMNRDDPARMLSRLMWHTAYTVHPYRHPVIGYPDVFNTLTRDDLIAFFQRHYTPDNMIVAIVGDVSAAEVETAVRALFDAVPRRGHAPIVLPTEPEQIAPRLLRQTGAYTLTRAAFAWPAVTMHHPDAPALDLLAVIAGEGRSSRLVRTLREEQRLVHEIEAWSYTPKDPGLFGVVATFDPDKEAQAIAAVEEEVQRWRTASFPLEEVEKARRQVLASSLAQYETMHGQADGLASGEFYVGDPRFTATYIRRLQAVTPGVVAGVAQRYLLPERRTLAVLAPTSAPPPAAAAPAELAVGEPQKIVWPNGAVLLVREDHKLPFVHFCVAFRGGLLIEQDAQAGITDLMADVMTRGGGGRSAATMAETVDALGGEWAAFSGLNSFGLRARCFSRDAATLMGLLADAALRPAFAPEEIETQRGLQLAALAEQRDAPMFVAQEALRGLLFPNHPYRFVPEGTPESVARLDRDALTAHQRKTVVAGNCALALFGDLTVAEAQRLAKPFLDALPEGPRPVPEHPVSAPTLPAARRQEQPREQAIVLFGFPGVALSDPRADALAVLQRTLSGLSSELMIVIREQKGLAYYAGAMQRTGLEPGYFGLYAGTRPEVLDQVQGLMHAELARVVGQGPRADEVERARQQLLAEQQQHLQLNGELALSCSLNELYGLGYRHDYTVEQRLTALTPADVQAAAASICLTNRLAVSLVVPEKKLQPE